MAFVVTLDTKQLADNLDALGERQIPFAAMKALNELGTTFQSREQQSIQSAMTIRRPWVLQGVKINRGDFATKTNLSVIVRIDDKRNFLDKFEDGGTRSPIGGALSLVVPVNVRPSKSQVIRNDQKPKAFQFQTARSNRKSQWAVYKGARGTFMLQRSNGIGLILQRSGSGGNRRKPLLGPSRFGDRTLTNRRWGHDPNVTILWNLWPTTHVPRILNFYSTAQSVLSSWPGTFEKWYLEALRTAK